MALTKSRTELGFQDNFVFRDAELVDGALTIHLGALLNYEQGNIGYALPATATSGEFAGIAAEEVIVAASDNTADGTKTCRIHAKGNGKVYKLPFNGSITRANIGDTVYVYDDEKVSLSGSVAVGTIVDVETNFVHVKI